jgi:hypothetical protein
MHQLEIVHKPNPAKHQPPESIRELICLDEALGQFFHVLTGKPYPLQNRGSKPSLNCRGDTYSAAKLAYWFTRGIYPASRVTNLDGDRFNFKPDNLGFVSKRAKPYRVRARGADGQLLHLGYFETPEEARAMLELHRMLNPKTP